MKKVTLGVRVDGAWPGLIDAQAEAQGISRSEWVQEAIASRLGVETPVNKRVNPDKRLDSIEGAIAQINDKLTALTHAVDSLQPLELPISVNELGMTVNAVNDWPMGNLPIKKNTPVNEPGVTVNGGVNDNGEWLTLTQAHALALDRGFIGSKNAFRGQIQRNPDRGRSRWGLAWHGEGNKNARAATFQDLWANQPPATEG